MGRGLASTKAKLPPSSAITTSATHHATPLLYFSDASLANTLCRSVAAWFQVNQRPLPWRPVVKAPEQIKKSSSSSAPSPTQESTSQTPTAAAPAPRDGYGTWVCEVMSQQTRIQTVVEYWRRWMVAFPTVSALAAADAERVRSLWTGLGFYRRAALLHKGAQYIVEHHGGELPRSAAELREIPGIGPYTAGAISSICFNEMTPAVDGNVVRVLSRLCGARDFDPKNPKSIKLAWEWANTLFKAAEAVPKSTTTAGSRNKLQQVDGYLPGALTEGLIEIGGTVCKPNGQPDCHACPISTHCRAKQLLELGDIESIDGIIPCRGGKPKVTLQECVSVVHMLKDAPNHLAAQQYVLVQRPPSGLLANLYEFPNILRQQTSPDSDTSDGSEADEGGSQDESKRPFIANIMDAITKDIKGVEPRYLGSYVHKFSHIHLAVHIIVVPHKTESALQQIANVRRPLLPKRCLHDADGATVSSDSADRRVVSIEAMKEYGVAKTVSKTIEVIKKKMVNSAKSDEARKPSSKGPSKRSRST